MTTTRGGSILGVLFLLLGLIVTGFVITSKPIATIPLCVGIAVAVLGALMVSPTAVKQGAADLSDTIGPYLPTGRRAGDPVVKVVTPPAKPDDGP